MRFFSGTVRVKSCKNTSARLTNKTRYPEVVFARERISATEFCRENARRLERSTNRNVNIVVPYLDQKNIRTFECFFFFVLLDSLLKTCFSLFFFPTIDLELYFYLFEGVQSRGARVSVGSTLMLVWGSTDLRLFLTFCR